MWPARQGSTLPSIICCFFFFTDPGTTEIFPLPLRDPLPISETGRGSSHRPGDRRPLAAPPRDRGLLERARRILIPCVKALAACRERRNAGDQYPTSAVQKRSEEHTAELQSRLHPACRLLLQK